MRRSKPGCGSVSKAKGMEDELCVKVQSVKIAGPDAETVLLCWCWGSGTVRGLYCKGNAVRRHLRWYTLP